MAIGDFVSICASTADGKGRLYRMEPGKRVVLDQYDQWEPNKEEPLLVQCARVSLSEAEQDRRKRGAQRLKESFSKIPFYAKAAEKDGDTYWERFYASRINW